LYGCDGSKGARGRRTWGSCVVGVRFIGHIPLLFRFFKVGRRNFNSEIRPMLKVKSNLVGQERRSIYSLRDLISRGVGLSEIVRENFVNESRSIEPIWARKYRASQPLFGERWRIADAK